jgi:lipopolysaccharide/colanic/teichoic acid biosynthesis glycosyltransferase
MAHIIKRVIEIGLATLALVLLAPTLLCLAAAVYLVDGRPVFVPENWIDRRGRTITLFAFRTKRVGFNSHGDAMPLPWIGWYLKRGCLDRLPRYWHLLRGDCDLDALWF